VRADYPEAALQLLKTRPPFLDAKTNWGIQSAIGDISEYGDVALPKRLCELFPEDDTYFSWFANWAKTVSPREADRWLKDREQDKNADWYYVRLRFRAQLGTEHELLAPLEKAIRDHPDDYDRLDKYLTAMDAMRQVKGEPSLEWLTPVLKPRLAVQGFLFASKQSLSDNTRIALYEKSLVLPFTKQDAPYYAEFHRKYSAHRRREEDLTEKNLRAWTKRSLMYLYQNNGQPQKAQQLLEQLGKENPDGFDDYAGAGDIQRTSGARFFEAKILAEEPVEKAPEAPDSSADAVTSATYWLDRANYYIGRKEETRVREAFDKAIKLVPSIGTDAETLPIRGRIVAAYSAYLCQELHRPIAAYDFVHKLLESVPVTDDMVPMLVKQLQSLTELSRSVNQAMKRESDDDSDLPPVIHLDSNDPLLWAYLASQVTRSDRIQAVAAGKQETLLDYDLLENLLKEAPREKRAVLWQRAEDLLKGDSLSDRFALARKLSLIEGMESPLTERVYRSLAERTRSNPTAPISKRFPELYAYGEAIRSLWHAYERSSNYEGMLEMEAAFQNRPLSGLLTKDISPSRYLPLSRVAAKSGKLQDALRYYKSWLNQDRRVARSLRDMPELTEELRVFYKKMAEAEPECATPARVLNSKADAGRTLGGQ
jgi:tetratricopeptide (TPR) repeat protein